MTPRIHCVRHAQGYHNLSLANHALHDPLLTPLGEDQCRALARDFPAAHPQVDLVVASPIKRTLWTALLGFAPLLDRQPPSPVIALPDLQETSDLPCDTGSELAELQREFDGRPVDWALVGPGWNEKRRGRFAPNSRAMEARAREARCWLMARPEREVVVVAHGGFLHYLTEDWSSSDRYPGTGWANTEFRSYTFSALEPEAAHLVETPESRQRRRGGNGTATGTGMDEKPLDREEVAQWRRTGEKDEERREKEREREVGGRRERAASEGKAREARELLAKV